MLEDNKKYTFWNLINAHRIEIPMIQRDYTYGRKDTKTAQIMRTFVGLLINHLTNRKPIHLDFIYGKIEGKVNVVQLEQNKRAINNLLKSVQAYSQTLDIEIGFNLTDPVVEKKGRTTYFIPLDGQQRLTTLFLIHWYLSARIGSSQKVLANFTYRTRKSSKDFCSALISKGSINNTASSVDAQITNAPWFFDRWRKDPTVKSMLVVLEEIHGLLGKEQNSDITRMWNQLTESELITFAFLDTDRLMMTDELYVKMNARGKQLTDFENFKAWLQEYSREKEFSFEEKEWHRKLDMEWTDLFWGYKESTEFRIDGAYLVFFRLMGLYFYCENVTLQKGLIGTTDREVVDALRTTGFLPFETYINNRIFGQHELDAIFHFLNCIDENGHSLLSKHLANAPYRPSYDRLFANFVSSGNGRINLWTTVFLYTMVKFVLVKRKPAEQYDDTDIIQMQRWIRVTSNLLYNTTIDSQTHLVSAISAINSLSSHCTDIYQHLASLGTKIPFFSSQQESEERLKCMMIANDPNWEKEFIQYEAHPYFYGQINFLIDLSKVDGQHDILTFSNYARKAAAIFDYNILGHKDFLLQRALLTYGDYTVELTTNRDFLYTTSTTLRNREENWRRFFRSTYKQYILKGLLDDIDVSDVKTSLLNIIDKATLSGWRHYFVKYSEVLEYCKQMQARWIDAVASPDYVMLLGSTKMSGYHAELNSYGYYLEFLRGKTSLYKPFTNVDYYPVKGSKENPCAYIDNWLFSGSNFAIDISFIENQYKLAFFDRNEKDIPDTISEEIINQGFGWDNERHVKYVKHVQDVNNAIATLCTFFKTL